MRVAFLNGPNLNLLGTREPDIYGTTTLAAIEERVRARAADLGVEIEFHQTNHEGELVEQIHAARGACDGVVLNAAALTHTSIAVRDALLATRLPFVEVHLSNIFSREAERRQSVFGDLAVGFIAGFGASGYLMALEGLVEKLGPG